MRITLTLAMVVAVVLSGGQAAAQAAAEAVKGFSIVLLEGSMQAGPSSELPAPARAAIEDIKDFLPFKSFRLLDVSWMVGATDVRSRLNGGDRDYEVAVTVQPQKDANSLSIKFLLRHIARQQTAPSAPLPEASGTADFLRGQQEGLRANLQTAYERLQALREKYAEGHPSVQVAEQAIARDRDRLRMAEQQLDNLRRVASDQQRRATETADAALIDTSFSMRVGETVVVGTSRVNGDRALIALMTAVSREPGVVRRQF